MPFDRKAQEQTIYELTEAIRGLLSHCHVEVIVGSRRHNWNGDRGPLLTSNDRCNDVAADGDDKQTE